MVRVFRILVPCAFLSLLLFQGESHAQEDVHMKVRSRGFQNIRISVRPFRSKQPTETTEYVRSVVRNDLTLSGYFQVVDETPDVAPDRSNPASMGRPDIVLEGEAEIRGSIFIIDILVKERTSAQKILKKRFEGTTVSLRILGHRIADEVSSYLTGELSIACTRIAFIRMDRDAREIALIDYDGYGLKSLVSDGSLNLSPGWFSSGEKIIFMSYSSGRPLLRVLKVNDGKSYDLPSMGSLHSAPDVSPDGKRIAFSLSRDGVMDIVTTDADGRQLRQLTFGNAIETSPSWSPDGREIAFTSDRSGSPQIYVMDSEGGNMRRLTYEGEYNASPAWSPRGDVIAYVSRESGGFQIYLIDVNGENRRRMTDGSGTHEDPAWSPNGLWLAFTSRYGNNRDIYVIHISGQYLRRVTNDGISLFPAWSPRLSLP